MSKNRLLEERIDTGPRPIRSMSSNIPGHEERMKAHCVRVQKKYFDSGLHKREYKNEKLKLMRDRRSRG